MANDPEKTDRAVPLPIATERRADDAEIDTVASSDPADQIPVPIAMSAAEIDERAQAVEAVRGTAAPEPVEEPTLDDDDRVDA